MMDAVFDAIDLTTVATAVGGFMVAVVGIALAFKAGILGKRTVAKV
jgi:hypothetical protein